jgi:HAD superfamily hydrolase (TIGR01484 family)
MNVLALACDYDGTLAHDGVLDDATAAALDRFRASGRHLVMVTGRELHDLQGVCQVLDKFDWIVAENGALLYRPTDISVSCSVRRLRRCWRKLGEARAQPLSVGRAIIATREPHERLVLESIKSLGLELQIIFNKGAVMVLPTGVNKATGLTCALQAMGIDAQNGCPTFGA